MTSILVVDHDPEFADLVRDGLRDRKYSAESVRSAKAALDYLDRNPVDIVVAHVHLREVSGLELVSRLRDRQSEMLGIVVTRRAAWRPPSKRSAPAPTTSSASRSRSPRSRSRSSAPSRTRRFVARFSACVSTVAAAQPVETIIGDSPRSARSRRSIRRVAESPATVLVTGESGTGKELVARAIHERVRRRHEPFVAINCGAIAASAARERAVRPRARRVHRCATEASTGLFVQAGDGTLFLDEIGEMPLECR